MGAPTLEDFEKFYEGYDKAHLVSYPEQIAVQVIIFGLVLPGFILGVGLMLMKRHWSHPVIERRNPELVLLEASAASLSILSFLFPFAFPNRVNAGAVVFLNTFSAFVAFFTCIFRLATLSISLMIAAHFSKKGAQTVVLTKQNVWVRFGRLRRFPFNIIIIFGLIWIVTLPNFLTYLRLELKDEYSFFAFHYLYGTQNPFSAYVCFGSGFIGAFVLWRKLKSVGVENFGIQKELGGKVYVLAVFLAGLFGGGAVPHSFQVRYFHVQVVVYSIALLVELYVTLWQVIWKTRVEIKRVLARRSSDCNNSMRRSSDVHRDPGTKVSLEFIFQDPHLVELFREFLCRELCVENLNFVEAVNQFNQKYFRGNDVRWMKRHKLSWKTYVADCKTIYEEFCDTNCIAPVNISYVCREEIRLKVEQISASDQGVVDPHFFDSAYKDVAHLLARDSLMRFKDDVKYREYKKKVALAPLQTQTPTASRRTSSSGEKFWAVTPKHKKNVSGDTAATIRTSRRTSSAPDLSHSLELV
jgi:hypothetical protein